MILLLGNADEHDDVYDNDVVVMMKKWIAIEILKGLLEHTMD